MEFVARRVQLEPPALPVRNVCAPVSVYTCRLRAFTDHSTPVRWAECNLIAESKICNMPFMNYLRKKGYRPQEIVFPPVPPIAHPDARDISICGG